MKYLVPKRMQALEALRYLFPASSRRTLQHWIKGGRFLIDQQPLEKDNTWLEEGQTLSAKEKFSAPIKSKLNILFFDRSIVAIDKPSGLLSVPLDHPSSKIHAMKLLREHFQTDQIFAVHRLDRETSGVMIFARGKESQEKLKDLFEKHALQREYIAVVEGVLAEDQGTWRCKLRELPNYDVEAVDCRDLEVAEEEFPSPPRRTSEEGREAITHFEVLHRSAKYSYLRLCLETGRKHQIRIHCKMAGTPVLGDARYGSVENPLKRLALHARLLSFIHPFTKKKLLFTSPLPPAFKKLLPPTLEL